MCGIVGYIGNKDVKDILLHGLEKLEYRGYDSAGIAVSTGTTVEEFKDKGRIAHLRNVVDSSVMGRVGIGHTRWATHGKPNKRNSHPHHVGRFTIVHNGVIENYNELKNTYFSGQQFISDTDTEVIAALLDHLTATMDLEKAIIQLFDLLHGSYALGILDATEPEVLYAVKNKSPMLLGVGAGFNMIGSDAMAMLHETNEFIEINDQEFVRIERERIQIFNKEGQPVSRQSYIAQIDASDIEKGPYAHYMMKEIEEQPAVIRNIVSQYLDGDAIVMDEAIVQAVKKASRIYIIAAGTSMHAGLVGKQMLEELCCIPTEVHIASEFAYNRPIIVDGALFIFISQSGETADSRAVLVDIKKLGFAALTITNVAGSTLSREADHTLLIHAGPEIAVASTKAYTATMAVFALLTAKAAQLQLDLARELSLVASAMDSAVAEKELYEQIAKEVLAPRNAFYIGRHVDYYTAIEAALKLKEVSYIQAEGFAAGELKHGTIALIEEGTPVIGIISQEHINLNTRSNLIEVASRGAKTVVITCQSLSAAGDQIVLPDVHPLLAPLVTTIPTQYLAYYAALHRDLDIDKPRNLAKSVTVE